MALSNKKSSKDKFRLFARKRGCGPFASTDAASTDREVSVVVDANGVESSIGTRKTLVGSTLGNTKDVSINLSRSSEAPAWTGLSSSQSSGSATGHRASYSEETTETETTATDDVVDTLVRMWGYLGMKAILDKGQELLSSINSLDDGSSVASDDSSAVASAELSSSSYESDDLCDHFSFSETESHDDDMENESIGQTTIGGATELSFPTDETFESNDHSTCLPTSESLSVTLGEHSTKEVSDAVEAPKEVQLYAATSSTSLSTIEDDYPPAGAVDDPSDVESFSSGSSNSQDRLDFDRSSSHDGALEQAWEVTPLELPKLNRNLSQRRKVNTAESREAESEFSDDDEDGAHFEVFIGQIDF